MKKLKSDLGVAGVAGPSDTPTVTIVDENFGMKVGDTKIVKFKVKMIEERIDGQVKSYRYELLEGE